MCSGIALLDTHSTQSFRQQLHASTKVGGAVHGDGVTENLPMAAFLAVSVLSQRQRDHTRTASVILDRVGTVTHVCFCSLLRETFNIRHEYVFTS
jgi:hypothetical protein